MRSLYNADHRYTVDASILTAKASDAIIELMKEYTALGYSPRDISHIIQLAVFDVECAAVMTFKGERE